jgi:hypothetical protein
MEIPQEPALLQTAEETTRNTVADLTEPGLMPTILESAPLELQAQEQAAHQHAAVEYFPVAEPVAEAKPAEIAPVVEALVPEAAAVEAAVVESPVVETKEAEVRAESSFKIQEMAAAEVPVEAPEVLPADDLSAAPERIAEDADFDFEARVAAAMAAYNQTPVVEEPPVTEEPPVIEEAHAAISEEHAPSMEAMEADVHGRSVATSREPAEAVRHELEPPSSFEYYPPIRVPEIPRIINRPVMETPAVEFVALPVAAPVSIVDPAPPEAETETLSVAAPVPPEEMTWAAAPVAPPEPEVAESPATSAQHNAAVAAGLQAALPTAVSTAAEQTGADQEVIAQVVSRVMDRLKPTLVEEIMRELKSNK